MNVINMPNLGIRNRKMVLDLQPIDLQNNKALKKHSVCIHVKKILMLKNNLQ